MANVDRDTKTYTRVHVLRAGSDHTSDPARAMLSKDHAMVHEECKRVVAAGGSFEVRHAWNNGGWESTITIHYPIDLKPEVEVEVRPRYAAKAATE